MLSSVLVAACLGGCASPALVPGTGDVSFRLSWSGTADLDLYVEDPAGGELSFIKRQAASGGLLDIDCNSGPEAICRQPIENVYWPPDEAPEGPYTYQVKLFRPLEEGEVAYELEVRLGEAVVERRSGQLSNDAPDAGPFVYEFRRAVTAGAFSGG